MSDNESEADDRPISATEEFRRAWRNSLLWSLLAIAVGFGSKDSGVPITLLGTGLAFNQRCVAGGALAIAAFMFLVYLRSRTNDRRRNTQSAVEASSAALTVIIQHTVRDAEYARATVAAAKSIAENIEQRFLMEISRHKSALLDPRNRDTAVSELRQLSIPYKPPIMGGPDGNINDLKREFYTRITNRADQLELEQQQRIESGIKKVDEMLLTPANIKTNLLNSISAELARYDEATQRVGASAERLTKFYKGISRSDLRWYAALDVWAVYLMLVAALLVAGSRTLGYSPDRIADIEAPPRTSVHDATAPKSTPPPSAPPATPQPPPVPGR